MERNLITKIALVVAIIALIFSVATLVRSIIVGAAVLLAIIQVIGTVIIVAICSIMLYVLSTNEEDYDDGEEVEADTEKSADSAADALPEPQEDIDVTLDDIDEAADSHDYDLSIFE